MKPIKSKAKRTLTSGELQKASRAVKKVATAEGVNTIIAGGYAMQLYGSTRLTSDVDFVLERELPFPAKKPLSIGGIKTEIDTIPVDLIVRNDEYRDLYDHSLETAVRMKGIVLPVVRAEELAVMKIVANRPKDMLDLAYLITSRTLDLDRTKKLIREYLGRFSVRVFENYVLEAMWRKSVSKDDEDE